MNIKITITDDEDNMVASGASLSFETAIEKMCQLERYVNENYPEIINECDICDGTGIVDKMSFVFSGEAHMASVGTQKCLCALDCE